MIKAEFDISQIKNEITAIYNELYETLNMQDTQRRDTVNRLVEKLRHFKTLLDNSAVTVKIK